MNQHSITPPTSYRPLVTTWLVLVGLTALSVLLNRWFQGAAWLQLLVAAIVWIKGEMIARHFVETQIAHPFIRRVTHAFIAFTPAALILTTFFGQEFARFASI